jgi:hypothetical protein
MNDSKSKEISNNLSEEISETLFKSEEIMISEDFSSFTVLFNNPALRNYFTNNDKE